MNSKQTSSASSWRAKARTLAISVVGAAALTPSNAYAATSGVDLGEIMITLSDGMGFLGRVLLIFGLIALALTLKDGAAGASAGHLAGAIAVLVGASIIIGAAAYFAGLDTSWAG